jgi:hypothetical protein
VPPARPTSASRARHWAGSSSTARVARSTHSRRTRTAGVRARELVPRSGRHSLRAARCAPVTESRPHCSEPRSAGDGKLQVTYNRDPLPSLRLARFVSLAVVEGGPFVLVVRVYKRIGGELKRSRGSRARDHTGAIGASAASGPRSASTSHRPASGACSPKRSWSRRRGSPARAGASSCERSGEHPRPALQIARLGHRLEADYGEKAALLSPVAPLGAEGASRTHLLRVSRLRQIPRSHPDRHADLLVLRLSVGHSKAPNPRSRRSSTRLAGRAQPATTALLLGSPPTNQPSHFLSCEAVALWRKRDTLLPGRPATRWPRPPDRVSAPHGVGFSRRRSPGQAT